jgi:hypothetical protein
MATSSEPLTWRRLTEAADRLDAEVGTREHADGVFFHLLKCTVENLRAKREQAARPRRVLLVKSSSAAKGRAAPASAQPAKKMMTDKEVVELARRLARL